MLRKLQSLIDVRRRFGTAASLVKVIDALAGRTVGLKFHRVLWRDAIPPEPAVGVAGNIRLRALSSEDVLRGAQDPGCDLEPELADRLNNPRHLCFGAFDGQRLAAYSWYTLGGVEPEHSFQVGLSYPADMAYMYKTFTHVDYRGRRLQTAVHGLAQRELENRGIRQLVALVAWENLASLHSCTHAGFVPLGWLVTLSRRKWQYSWCPRKAEARGIVFTRKGLIKLAKDRRSEKLSDLESLQPSCDA